MDNELPESPPEPKDDGKHECDIDDCNGRFFESDLVEVFGKTVCPECLENNSSLTYTGCGTFEQES